MLDTRTLTIVICLWIGVTAFVLVRWLHSLALPEKRTPPAHVREEFLRRRRAVFWDGAVIVAGMATMILSYSVFTIPLPGFLGSTSFAIAFAVAGLVAFAVGVRYLRSRYRCPACEWPLADGGAVILNPTTCPGCGADLR